jgi:hypothetical protein
MSFHDDDAGICGVATVRHPDHSLSLNMHGYILDFLHTAGMDHVPAALSPSLKGLFDTPTGPPLSDSARKQFQRNNGGLIHMLPVRFDIRMEVSHLCSLNARPTEGDSAKQVQLMRYLKGCPNLGPTFSADPASYPHGVTLVGAADSSHAAHYSDGRSHSAYMLTVGSCNAPFMVYSCAESGGIALSPHESEYMALSRLARMVLYFRQFAKDLGYSHYRPTPLLEDSRTAINLTFAPSISRKSRHISQRHHFIRWLAQQGEVISLHKETHDIVPDGMTKVKGPTDFLYFRHQVFHPFKR